MRENDKNEENKNRFEIYLKTVFLDICLRENGKKKQTVT
jgi:hypothetical protein